MPALSATSNVTELPKAEIVSQKTLYSKYMTLYDRRVRFTSPEGKVQELDFDVIGHPQCNFQFAVAFPFHRAKNGGEPEVTLVKEYAQGPNRMVYCLPTGGFDPQRHTDLEACAKAELSEEGHLRGGEIVRLLPKEHTGLWEVKWCANHFVPYLVIDPEVDPTPGSRDYGAEEHIQIVRVPVSELRRIMVSGDMMLPSLTSCFMALTYLEKHGLL